MDGHLKRRNMASTDNSSRAPEQTTVEAWLESDRTATGSARALVQVAAEDMLGATSDDAALVASELVANAVEHGTGDEVRLRLRRSGSAQLEVSVFNRVHTRAAVLPERPWRMPGVDAIRGRGLAVVESLSSRIGVQRTGSSVEVSALVEA